MEALGDSGGRDAKLSSNLLAFEAINVQHLKDDGCTGVAPIVAAAELKDGVAEVLLKVIVGDVELDVGFLNTLFETVYTVLTLIAFESVE